MSIIPNLIKVKSEIIEWIISYWQYFCRKLKDTPWYLKPFNGVFLLICLLDDIGRIQINVFPRKFKTWQDFEAHLDGIINILKQKNELAWAQRLYEAKHVSQSSWEVLYELVDELRRLNNDAVSKKLRLRKDIKKAISYLQSFK